MKYVGDLGKEYIVLHKKLQDNMRIVGSYDTCYAMLQRLSEELRELSKMVINWEKMDSTNPVWEAEVRGQMRECKVWLEAARLNIEHPKE